MECGASGLVRAYYNVLLLTDAPSIDANEITDKGYINQRLALERRAADVGRLYAATPDEDVIVF
jgi:feruloyl-CoA synthase